ncbi:MAG: hypothetical protein PHD64_11500 [Mesotoga sp.]|jgi:uncharacterized coiled-coil protein SlyX|nr:hypothetical protein [Mesotoga sp.]
MKAHIDEPVKVGDILRVARIVPSQDGCGYVILNFAKGYEIVALQARIAELEKAEAFDHAMVQREIETVAFSINGHLATIDRQAAYIKRLEGAFRKLYVNELAGCGMPRDTAESHASDALEELRK